MTRAMFGFVLAIFSVAILAGIALWAVVRIPNLRAPGESTVVALRAWIAAAGPVVALVAALLAGFIGFQGLRVSQQSLQAADRPWVYADVTMDGPVFTNQSGGMTFPIRFTFHNTGRAPAMYVVPIMKMIAAHVDSIAAEQKKVADAQRAIPASASDVGLTVFPGQTIAGSYREGLSAADIKAAVDAHTRIGFSPIIVGCLDYRFPGDREHHQTGFAFFINMLKEGGPIVTFLLPPDPTTLPVDKLVISNWIEGSTFAAD